MTSRKVPDAVITGLEDHAAPRSEGFVYDGPESRLSGVRCGCGELLPVTRRSLVLDAWRRHVAAKVAAALGVSGQETPEPTCEHKRTVSHVWWHYVRNRRGEIIETQEVDCPGPPGGAAAPTEPLRIYRERDLGAAVAGSPTTESGEQQ
jgi:hypothetical protein